MIEKLDNKELERISFMHCPVAMMETLIPSNLKAPHTWGLDDQGITMRPYQFSMLDYSYMYADDPELNEKENFKKKIGAGTCYNISARNLGKCEWIDNKCLLSNGSLKNFGELIGSTQSVISYNEDSGQLEKDIAYFDDNGLKDCYCIRLKSGKELILTKNHPLLTNEGWKKVEDLKLDLMIATPKKYHNIGNISVNENLAKLLGYLIGDGSCTTTNISVTNINNDIISELYNIATYFNCQIHKYEDAYFFTKTKEEIKKFHNHKKNNIHKIVLKYKLNKLSKEKTVPQEVFKWNNKNIAILLNRLFACDGYINQRDRELAIEITLSSKQLIYDIKHLLLRFGIHSDINYKTCKCNNKYFDGWRLTVGKDSRLFLKEIGIFSKDNNIELRNDTWSTSDIIPKNLVHKIYNNLHYFSNFRKNGFSRIKVRKVGIQKNNQELIRLSEQNIYWDVLESIEYIGLKATVEVYVKKNHNYISNDVISHNSWLDQCNDFFTLIHNEGDESCHSSFDFKHLKKVLTPVANLAKYHPFFEMFRRSGKDGSVRWTGGGLEVDTMLGHVLYGKNEKVDTDEPGTDYHGLHVKKMTIEEFSYASDLGKEKRIDAISNLGCIERFSGIPDVRKGSPLGDLLLDDTKKNRICRLPQMVMETWDEDSKQRAIKEYGGENSFQFKLNILAESIEGAFGRWDMRRVRKLCYNPKKKIKEFEFGRDNIAHLDSCSTIEEKTEKIYELLTKTIVIDNVPSELTIIASDIGTTDSPSQICIFFGNKDKMKWRYLISLFRLTTQEQARVFNWIYNKLDNVVISLDCTNADGRAIADELEILGIQKDRITRCIMNAKIKVGFVYGKDGHVETEKNGEPIYKMESTIDWACSELDKIFYNGLIEVPHSDIFLKEFPAYFAVKIGTGYKYDSSTTNHVVQSFQCFSICRFYNLNTDLLEQKIQSNFVGGF